MYRIKGLKILINNLYINLKDENIKFDLMDQGLNLEVGGKIFINIIPDIDGYGTTFLRPGSVKYREPNYTIKEISVIDGYISINCEYENIDTIYNCIETLDNNKIFIDLGQPGLKLINVETLKNRYYNTKNKDYKLIKITTNSKDFIYAIKCVSLNLILFRERI